MSLSPVPRSVDAREVPRVLTIVSVPKEGTLVVQIP